MKILALDLATVTGVAIGNAGGIPTAWSVDLGEGRSQNARFANAIRLTQRLCEEHKPDLVAIEAPIGGMTTSHYLVGLWACVVGSATSSGCRSEKFDIASVRKHFLGKHLTVKHFPGMTKAAAKKEIKLAVVNRCGALGWVVRGHDAADAAATWDFACSTHHPSHHTTTIGGLFI